MHQFSLGNQQAIERIPVMHRKQTGANRVREGDGQFHERLARHYILQPGNQRSWPNFAEINFDCDFPSYRSGNQDFIGGVANKIKGSF